MHGANFTLSEEWQLILWGSKSQHAPHEITLGIAHEETFADLLLTGIAAGRFLWP